MVNASEHNDPGKDRGAKTVVGGDRRQGREVSSLQRPVPEESKEEVRDDEGAVPQPNLRLPEFGDIELRRRLIARVNGGQHQLLLALGASLLSLSPRLTRGSPCQRAVQAS